jgi:Ca2+-binding RTX toxin-like protein
MASSVTIFGSASKPVTLSFDSTANFALAAQIAARINAGIAAGTLLAESDANGPPPALPGTVSGAYFQASSGIAALPKGYAADVITKPGSAIVFGSGAAGEMILSGETTDLTFIAASGSGSVVAGGGNDRIVVGGTGNWSLSTGNGNDIISAVGTGSATVSAGGGNNAILLGPGKAVVTSAGDDTIYGGTGAETVDATGAHSDFVQGNASHLLFIGGLGGATILGGTGSDTYFGSNTGHAGPQLVTGGTEGNNYLFAGDGAATLTGGGSGDQLFAYGTTGQLLRAGAGNETLSAALSAGNDTLVGGSGKDVLIGGAGSDTFVGGSGHATVTAGIGSQVFDFVNHQAGGTELVQGIFDPSSIKIDLQGYGPNATAEALEDQTVKNGSVTIGLSDGTKVTFQDVTALNRSNFT